jgi:putative transcriptional regulator
MIDAKLNKGKILIAEPAILNDSSFNRSVILLTEHNEEGSVGFILNKPSKYTIVDLIPEIDSDHIVYNGGPVSMDNLYFIHSVPELIPNSVQIDDGIFWAGDFEMVKSLLINKTISPNQIRFFLGYTGWSANQLKDEMKTTSWMLKKNEYHNILSVSTPSFWRNELIKCGGEYQIWANAPEDPNMN